MIYDDKPWRKSLKQNLKIIRKLSKNFSRNETDFFKLDSSLILSFFIIRKLNESKRWNQDLNLIQIEVVSQKTLIIDKTNKLIEYTFENKKFNIEQLTIREIANQFIHSAYLSCLVGINDELDGIYVSSDNTIKEECYFIDISAIEFIIETVIKDRIILNELDEESKTIKQVKYVFR